MQFVEKHFTKHHLFHAPHKWFFAFLLSPLHAAELHYKRKYHMTFGHAKKLFFFDMVLLLSTVVLAGASAVWYFYDPTVLDLVSLSIRSSEERIESGQYVTYRFEYKNFSDRTLTSPKLSIDVPAGFDLEQNIRTFDLPDLPPGATGEMQISGWFFDIPNETNRITATLSYIQEGREVHEIKARQTLTTLRGSVLKATITAPEAWVARGRAPIVITLRNEGARPLEGVQIPLTRNPNIVLENISVDVGTVGGGIWRIETLAPGTAATLRGVAVSNFSGEEKQSIFTLIPAVRVRNVDIPQAESAHRFTLLHPNITIQSAWAEDLQATSPGTVPRVTFTVQNTGDAPLENIALTFSPPTDVVNMAELRRIQSEQFEPGTLTLAPAHAANLASLAPGAETQVTIPMPILTVPQGTDIILSIPVRVRARLRGRADATYETNTQSAGIAIGTQLLLNAEARYFTLEGDQLGRGPLPPEVGKQTKYSVLIRLDNTTSEARDIRFSASLPPHVSWTDRASVSIGPEPTVNTETGLISWSLRQLPAHTSVHMNLVLAITPAENDIGTTPVLLQNISGSEVDTVTGETLLRRYVNIDASLPNDGLALERGVRVRGQ